MFGFYYASKGVQKLDFRVTDDTNSRFFCLTVCGVVGVCGLVQICDTNLVEFCSPISSCNLFILLTDSNSTTSVLGAGAASHRILCVSVSPPTTEGVSVSSFCSVEERGPHHLFNALHLLRWKSPRVFRLKFISHTSASVFKKGGEVKQLQEGLRQNK